MTTINSVLGPIDTAGLGFTLMHEHLLIVAAGIPPNYTGLLGNGFMETIIKKLTRAKQEGIDTIVDATTLDLGRDVTVMAEAAHRSGVNIIACTGWWLDIPTRFFDGVSIDQFVRLFVREIKEGIAGTDIKAGIIKAASDMAGVLPEEEVILRAVARAHLETNAPIMLHSYSPGQIARQQLAILRDEGVDLRRVKVDHSNDTTDLEYLTWLLDQGCYLGLDRYPGRNTSPLARTRTMKALIDAGYRDHLLPSHDCSLAWPITETSPDLQQERETRFADGLLYMKKVVFPQLAELGVPEADIASLCVDGPRKFFEGVKNPAA